MKFLPLVLALAFAPCAGSAVAQVTATEPWVRAPVSAGQKATGLFVTLQSAQEARLVSVQSPVAGIVEIHEMKMDDGVMRMRALKDGLALPAGQAVALKPGGYHVMLIDLKQRLVQGDEVPFTLTLKGADGKTETLDLKATVKQTHITSMPGK